MTAGRGEPVSAPHSFLSQGALPTRSPPPMSEDLLYGDPAVSLVDEDLRLIVDLKDGQASLWRLDESGREVEDLSSDPVRREQARPLYEGLLSLRGDLEPRSASGAVTVPGPETFEALRALGYVE